MAIEDRKLVVAGAHLTARFKGKEYSCRVVDVDGSLRFRLPDGQEYKSPSGASAAIVQHASNGFAFWSLAGAEPMRKPRAAKAKASKPSVTAKERKADAQRTRRAKAKAAKR
jgi:hypothetical protein